MTKEEFLRLPINERINKLYDVCKDPRRSHIEDYIIEEDLLPEWVAGYAENDDRYSTLYFELVLEHMSEELEFMKEDGEDESGLIPNEDWDKWYDLVFAKKIYGFKIDW